MPFVHVRARVMHAVIVEPQEPLLLAVVATCRIHVVQVVAPFSGMVGAFVLREMVRIAVALGRGVPIVQMRKEAPVGRAEVLAVEAMGI